jgi:hypothetical protein
MADMISPHVNSGVAMEARFTEAQTATPRAVQAATSMFG